MTNLNFFSPTSSHIPKSPFMVDGVWSNKDAPIFYWAKKEAEITFTSSNWPKTDKTNKTPALKINLTETQSKKIN